MSGICESGCSDVVGRCWNVGVTVVVYWAFEVYSADNAMFPKSGGAVHVVRGASQRSLCASCQDLWNLMKRLLVCLSLFGLGCFSWLMSTKFSSVTVPTLQSVRSFLNPVELLETGVRDSGRPLLLGLHRGSGEVSKGGSVPNTANLRTSGSRLNLTLCWQHRVGLRRQLASEGFVGKCRLRLSTAVV